MCLTLWVVVVVVAVHRFGLPKIVLEAFLERAYVSGQASCTMHGWSETGLKTTYIMNCWICSWFVLVSLVLLLQHIISSIVIVSVSTVIVGSLAARVIYPALRRDINIMSHVILYHTTSNVITWYIITIINMISIVGSISIIGFISVSVIAIIIVLWFLLWICCLWSSLLVVLVLVVVLVVVLVLCAYCVFIVCITCLSCFCVIIFALPSARTSRGRTSTRTIPPRSAYIYIYVYRERERDIDMYICIYIYIYIYIYTHICVYIYIYKYRERERFVCVDVRMYVCVVACFVSMFPVCSESRHVLYYTIP